MRPCDRIHELPTSITLGRRPCAETPREPVLVSFVLEPPPHDGPHFHFPMRDSMNPELLPERADLVEFLEEVHPAVSAQASYWHCHAGQNRSAFGLAAYLHLYRGLSISQSIALLRQRRDERILCNPLFEASLRSWFGTSDEQSFLSPALLSEPIPLGEAALQGEPEGAIEIFDFSKRAGGRPG